MLRKAAVLSTALALAAVCVVVVWGYWALWRPLDNRELELVVAEGTPAGEVLDQLHGAGLMPSPMAGRLYLRLFGGGRTPRWGSYRFPARGRPVDAIEQLLDGRVETVSVTVVEGSTAAEIAEICVGAGIGSPGDWRDVIARSDWIGDLAGAAPSLEGFLFPDTYRFAVGLPVTAAARHMVEQFRQVWREETQSGSSPWTAPLDIVTLASLVEAETSVPDERPRIAGVFRNRLRRGMLLQCDPTVIYALKRRGEWQGRLLRRHWTTDDPYNTYRYPGLPPGPINSPGRAALAAALAPEEHGFLYFVASPEGGHTFSRTLAEHERAVARWMASRR
jgi:UPF0755 protein